MDTTDNGLVVLYLIMGVGVNIVPRWVPAIESGGFSPIPFFYVTGGNTLRDLRVVAPTGFEPVFQP